MSPLYYSQVVFFQFFLSLGEGEGGIAKFLHTYMFHVWYTYIDLPQKTHSVEKGPKPRITKAVMMHFFLLYAVHYITWQYFTLFKQFTRTSHVTASAWTLEVFSHFDGKKNMVNMQSLWSIWETSRCITMKPTWNFGIFHTWIICETSNWNQRGTLACLAGETWTHLFHFLPRQKKCCDFSESHDALM